MMFLKTPTARALALGIASLAVGAALQSTSRADAINLGQAANFAVFGYNNVLDPTPVNVNGNIGVGTGGKMEFHGTGLNIAGQAIYADPITSSNFATSALNGASINGQSFNGSITTGLANGQLVQNSAIAQQAGADIQTLATWAAGQSSNATLPANMTINTQNGSGSTYVADLSSLSITSGHTLSITGDSSDYYVFDINGGFTMSGSGSIVLNGVSSDHVLFNIEGTDHAVNISGSSVGYGVILDYSGPITVDTPGGSWNGRLFAGPGEEIHLFSEACVNQPNTPPPAPLPAPLWSAAALLAMLGLGSRLRLARLSS